MIMKELSIEEKAKAYDEAIKRVEDIVGGKCPKPFVFTEGLFDYIFPELKESEDEKIRACIGMCLTDIDEQRFADFNTNLKECRAWLEKQGEPKETLCDKCKKTQPSHSCQDITALGRCALEKQGEQKLQGKLEDDVRRRSTIQVLEYARSLDTYNQYGKADIDKNIAWLEKQSEQKPKGKTTLEAINEEKVDNANKVEPQDELTEFEKAVKQVMEEAIECGDTHNLKADADMLLNLAHNSSWSEEDETNLRRTEYAVMKFFGGDCSLVDWLRKSLKERYTWKPSDEQMEALEHFVRSIGESGYASPYDNNTKLLYSLLSDLKKLKE